MSFDFIVLKKPTNLFTVQDEKGNVQIVPARKNLKKDGIFVGDKVLLDEDGAVAKIAERKNLLIRPPVANIDRMFIVIAPVPKPDLYTVDKLLIFCKLNSIEPVLCINKCDLDHRVCVDIEKVYKGVVKTLIFSTLDESVNKLMKEIKGVCVLAGQSAVGKSSIINALKKKNLAQVDTFSKKIERGKQTTRVVQLYEFGKNKFLADTAGFSKLDEALLNLEKEKIKSYYEDFLPFATACKYLSCLHTAPKDCGVCKAVKDGKISEVRYKNYLKMLEIVKNLKKY